MTKEDHEKVLNGIPRIRAVFRVKRVPKEFTDAINLINGDVVRTALGEEHLVTADGFNHVKLKPENLEFIRYDYEIANHES